MEAYKIQIIETIVVIISYFFFQYVTKTLVNNSLKKKQIDRGRRKMTIKAIHLFSLITTLVLLSAIWGLKQNEIAVFAGAVLTALGIAFFAQWSLLSNITSSILLFFNHPIKIGDTIKILDKDYPFEGEVSDLAYFFVHVKTENGEIITIPNSLLLQKSISIKENQSPENIV
jgi:small-conductance mechanosensitive channel